MQAATEKAQRESALAASEKRRRWRRTSKAKIMRADVVLDENVVVNRENVTQGAAAARTWQEFSAVVIEDSVRPPLRQRRVQCPRM